MGARSPANMKTRRSAFKCEFCGRNLISAEGLKSHQRSLHSVALKDKEKGILRLKNQSQTVVSKVQKPKKSIVVKKVAKLTPKSGAKKMPLEMVKHEISITTEEVPDTEEKAMLQVKGLKPEHERKVEFKCPKCHKLFPVYFSALRHVQKYHCVNEKDEKV